MNLKNDFIEKLTTLSKSISLDWLAKKGDNIQQTDELNNLFALFPPLQEIMAKGQKNDLREYHRTLVHIFQTQAVYNRIVAGDFPESTLDRNDIKDVCKLAHLISSFSSVLMPAILWLHDVGRFKDKKQHNEISAEMIMQHGMLNDNGLKKEEIILIQNVVKHHLLIGTLYTGESSYTSFEHLLKDDNFLFILDNNKLMDMFLDSLTLFTMIDVWGYHINDISVTMIKNYFEINREIKTIFCSDKKTDEIMNSLREKSRDHLDWRLMGYLMAFSKIGKKSHLTYDYYLGLIKQGFKKYIDREGIVATWDEFKEKYLNKINKVEFKYGLGILIPLSYGGTGRKMHLTKETIVNPNLFHLLVKINERISKEEKSNRQCISMGLWNVIFKGYPPWNQSAGFFQKLNKPECIENVVRNGFVQADHNGETNVLTIDYNVVVKI